MKKLFVVPFIACCAFMMVGATACGDKEEEIKCTWEDENKKDGPRICPSGYSCLIDLCIKDHSLEEKATCIDDIQCAEGLFCKKPSGADGSSDALTTFSCQKK